MSTEAMTATISAITAATRHDADDLVDRLRPVGVRVGQRHDQLALRSSRRAACDQKMSGNVTW